MIVYLFEFFRDMQFRILCKI